MANPDDAIERRDQLLELLYWIEGEGFPGASTIEGLSRFLAQPAATVLETLDDLRARGEVTEATVTGEYRLTDTGRREGARRFADEFAPMLAQGHGECRDPDCDCRDSPLGPAACRSHGGH